MLARTWRRVCRVMVVGALLAALGFPVQHAATAPQRFHGIAPARVVDTREGRGGFSYGPDEARDVPIAGVAGVPVRATGVVLNVTVTNPTATGYVTVWPSGATRPSTSNVNTVAGETVANAVVVGLGTGGRVRVANAFGRSDVLVDVLGWFDGGFAGVVPARLLDTRTDGSALGPGEVRTVRVAGAGGVPAGATAVVLTVTATRPSAGGYLTVWPSGGPRPVASSVNMLPGQTVAGLVVAGVGADGAVAIANDAGTTDVVVDVSGWFGVGGGFTGVQPRRLLDTRTRSCGMRLGPGEVRTLPVTGLAQVPGRDAGGVVLNVTVVDATDLGYVTLWPTGQARPDTSSVNTMPGRAVPNLVALGTGVGGQVSIANGPGTTEVLVDVTGWFDGTVPAGTAGPCPGSTGAAGPDPTRSSLRLGLENVATLPPGGGRRMMKLADAGDGTGRRFVSVTEGQIYVIDPNGSVRAQPFLDLPTALGSDFTVGPGAFGGLTYFAFHPDFAVSGRPGFHKLYTAHEERVRRPATFSMGSLGDLPPDFTTASQRVVAEWTVDPNDANRVDPASYREVLRLEQRDPVGDPHGIGEIAFNPYATADSPDRGLLYVAVGDSNTGPAATFSPWAQRLDNPFGKILRFDPLASGGSPYRVPADNPFVGRPGAAPLVWAYGLRDPQTFTWVRASDASVHLVVADIGQNANDEIDVVVRGGNYGWDAYEAFDRFDPISSPDPSGPLVGPRIVLDRDWPSNQIDAPAPPTTGARALIVGAAYTGSRAPALQGQFVFADLVRGRFFHVPVDALVAGPAPLSVQELLVYAGGTERRFVDLVGSGNERSDTRFGVDANGDLYVLDKYDRTVRRVTTG